MQVRHEEAGALAAAAYAKLTGKLGVCMAIAGTWCYSFIKWFI
ncbi:thiamine pyrophosphate-binding protein [Bacillus cereus]